MKYSILMPYFNREGQLETTLETFRKWYHKRDDYEIIIIVDAKSVEDKTQFLAYLSTIDKFGDLPIVVAKTSDPNIWISSQAYNIGRKIAKGDYLILTCPEVKHMTDVLGGFDTEFEENPKAYVVCACEALKEDGSHYMWYHNKIHRASFYHFCSAIHKDVYDEAGGFPEVYKDGYAYEDTEFRDNVYRTGVEFISRDDLMTIHQWHGSLKPPDHVARVIISKKLYWERRNANPKRVGLTTYE